MPAGGLRRALAAYVGFSELVLRLLGRRPRFGIVRLALEGELPEQPGGPAWLGLLQRRSEGFLDALSVLRWAAVDSEVRAVFLSCGVLEIGWARVQELRRALLRVRAAGKKLWVHLEHAGIHEYVLATAAERVTITPTGTLDVAGLSVQVTFFAAALRQLGIEPELIQVGQYKSAAESFTRTDMSDAHREMTDALVADLYAQIVDAVADGRRMAPAVVRGRNYQGPFTACE